MVWKSSGFGASSFATIMSSCRRFFRTSLSKKREELVRIAMGKDESSRIVRIASSMLFARVGSPIPENVMTSGVVLVSASDNSFLRRSIAINVSFCAVMFSIFSSWQ